MSVRRVERLAPHNLSSNHSWTIRYVTLVHLKGWFSISRQSDSYPTYDRATQIYFKNQTGEHPTHLPLPHVLQLVTDSFTGATERHIEVRAARTFPLSFVPSYL